LIAGPVLVLAILLLAAAAAYLLRRLEAVSALLAAGVSALLAVGLWGGAAIGFLLGPLNALERVAAFAAAALLVAALPLTDELGFAACGAFLLWHWLGVRRARSRAA